MFISSGGAGEDGMAKGFVLVFVSRPVEGISNLKL